MLFGKLIFIKKTGGDGSRFPVTERKITIGRSEECSIRIHKPQVAQQHCHLNVDDTGQVKLKNLSNHTFLNGKPLNLGEFILHHYDIVKIGGRMARWEYTPTSKYYQQTISSPGRLVVVVKPQKRSEDSLVGKESSNSLLLPKSSSGLKRRFSDKPSGNGIDCNNASLINNNNVNKINCTNGAMLTPPQQSNFNVHSTKSCPIIKGRENKSKELDVSLTDTPLSEKAKSRVSPSSRKIKMTALPNNRKSIQRKSTPIKKNSYMTRKFGTSLKQRSSLEASDLSAIKESTPEENIISKRQSLKLTESFISKNKTIDETPKKKIQPKRLIESEKKIKTGRSSASKNIKVNRLSLATRTIGATPRLSLLKSYSKKLVTASLQKKDEEKTESDLIADRNTCQNQTQIKTPLNSDRILRNSVSSLKISHNKNLDSSNDLICFSTPKLANPRKFSTSHKKKLAMNVENDELKAVSVSKPLNNNSLVAKQSQPSSRKKKTAKPQKNSSLNMPDILAKKAAQKLKSISPRKPDKNKKAALLVLGKAIRKQSVPKNVNIILKKKILKKAIKHSLGVPNAKNSKSDKLKYKKEPKKPKDKSQSVNEMFFKASLATNDGDEKEKVLNENSDEIDKFKKQTLTTEQSSQSKIYNSYLFNSNRCSKRLIYKNEKKPEYMELSPTALGLIPKNLDHSFRTPSMKKRRSTSLTTPKKCGSDTKKIKKSASTNKKFNKRSLRKFSSKNLNAESDFFNSFSTQETPFKFESVRTPNISLDVFISPLTDSEFNSFNNAQCHLLSEKKKILLDKKSLFMLNSPKNNEKNIKCSRKLLESPNIEHILWSEEKTPKKELPNNVIKNSTMIDSLGDFSDIKSKCKHDSVQKKNFEEVLKSLEINERERKLRRSCQTRKSLEKNSVKRKNNKNNLENIRPLNSKVKNSKQNLKKNIKKELIMTPKIQKNPKNDLNDFKGVKKLLATPKIQKSPKNDLSDLKGVKKLLATPKIQKSPKNDLSDLKGVKKLLATPKVQKSPKNDLSDLRGVKKLLATPKVQKSPKNDLSDFKGVKKLLATPKVQKSPKNDLSDLRGVKKLLATPKVQKSPKNDLSDFKGVKKLLATAKVQKSPKNDLSDLRGVKKLLATPKLQKSPKNDLSDLRGVKKLLATPKLQKSPKNDLNDFKGVKKLLATPKLQKSPKNDLNDFKGVKKLLATPKIQKSPKNDLSDLKGVKKLLATPKIQKSPKNDLSDLKGVKKLLATPKVQKSPKNDLSDFKGVKKLLATPKAQKSPKNDLSDLRGVKKLLATPKVQKSPKNDLSNLKGIKKLLATPKIQKSPKNDLSDLRGVKKLLETPKSQKSPRNDLSDLEGVKELLASPIVQKYFVHSLENFRQSQKSLLITHTQSSFQNNLINSESLSLETQNKGKNLRNSLETPERKLDSDAEHGVQKSLSARSLKCTETDNVNNSMILRRRNTISLKIKSMGKNVTTDSFNISFTGLDALFDSAIGDKLIMTPVEAKMTRSRARELRTLTASEENLKRKSAKRGRNVLGVDEPEKIAPRKRKRDNADEKMVSKSESVKRRGKKKNEFDDNIVKELSPSPEARITRRKKRTESKEFNIAGNVTSMRLRSHTDANGQVLRSKLKKEESKDSKLGARVKTMTKTKIVQNTVRATKNKETAIERKKATKNKKENENTEPKSKLAKVQINNPQRQVRKPRNKVTETDKSGSIRSNLRTRTPRKAKN